MILSPNKIREWQDEKVISIEAILPLTTWTFYFGLEPSYFSQITYTFYTTSIIMHSPGKKFQDYPFTRKSAIATDYHLIYLQ